MKYRLGAAVRRVSTIGKTSPGLVLAGSVLVAIASPALAQQVTVGVNNGGNCYPFTCTYSGTYQQVYGASNFSGPTSIDTVSFFKSSGYSPSANGNSYTLAFYLTNSAVGGLSTNPAANETTLLSNFGTFVPGTSYTFTGNGFTYDPTLGNLLLSVATTGSTGSNGSLQADYSTSATSRLYQIGGTGALTTQNNGLVTQFSYTGAVPEPATWAMMLLGFGGIGSAMRRRKSNLPKLA